MIKKPNGSSRASAAKVLGEPLTINGVTLKNRFILGPMAVLQPLEDGRPSDQSIAFLKRRAEGGVSLVFVGGSVATQRAWDESPFAPNIRFDKEEFIPELARLVEEVHASGALVFAQIFPSFGRMGIPRNGNWPTAASPVPVTIGEHGLPDNVYIPGGMTTPPAHEATADYIKEIEAAVVTAARIARAAGFDGLEIAAHMCYFYSSFLSPHANKRTDKYGGSAKNRARALRDAVHAVRAEVGASFPVGLRMSVNDHLPGGQDSEGFAEVASHIVSAGVDFIALTDANYESMGHNVTSISGSMLLHGEPQAFRKAVGNIPLFLSSTTSPQQAAAAIADGVADASMLARQLLADPDYPAKVLGGRESEIVWCDHSNSCLRSLMTNIPVTCHKNPEMGSESPQATRVKAKQKIMVWASGNKPLMSIADRLARARRSHH